MIVVDTTVWIDFLEGRETPFDHRLAELIADGDVRLTSRGPTWGSRT